MIEAKKLTVPPDTQPTFFIIEILDKEQKPIKERTKFLVAVDERNQEIIETNERGLLKVPMPKNKIKLSLVDKKST